MHDALHVTLILLASAVAVVVVFRTLAMPAILGYLLVGALVGPHALGLVAATEDQVCKHLDEHLEQLPADDARSRAILEQMRIDEEQHATSALEAGGLRFPAPVKFGMTLLSRVMTKSTYRV